MEVKVLNIRGEEVGNVSVPEEVFNVERKDPLLHQVVTMHLARRRAGTASTKTRSEVRGGGRKPWRQKGTGRARAGSIRSPLWRSGGRVFGPKPRDFGFSLPKKAQRLALASALSWKRREGKITVVDELVLEKPKTREAQEILEKLNIEEKCLLVLDVPSPEVIRAFRNLKNVDIERASQLNTYEVLTHKQLLFTKKSLEILEERLRSLKKGKG